MPQPWDRYHPLSSFAPPHLTTADVVSPACEVAQLLDSRAMGSERELPDWPGLTATPWGTSRSCHMVPTSLLFAARWSRVPL